MEKLKKAFKNRIGKKDNKSFREVVVAFFEEVRDDSLLIVPMNNIKKLGYKPMIIPITRNDFALVVISDAEYMSYFNDQTYAQYSAKTVISIMEEHEEIAGIIINPFTEYHCFLPKEDIRTVMKANKF